MSGIDEQIIQIFPKTNRPGKEELDLCERNYEAYVDWMITQTSKNIMKRLRRR